MGGAEPPHRAVYAVTVKEKRCGARSPGVVVERVLSDHFLGRPGDCHQVQALGKSAELRRYLAPGREDDLVLLGVEGNILESGRTGARGVVNDHVQALDTMQ